MAVHEAVAAMRTPGGAAAAPPAFSAIARGVTPA
jgi:hypothetical protein